jgi:hypothetical protein
LRPIIAALDQERQVVIIRPTGEAQTLSLPALSGGLWADWGRSPAAQMPWSWPTWSPDGRQIAAFRIDGSEKPTSGREMAVQIFEAHGPRLGEAVEIFQVLDRLPIYLQWSVQGNAIAVLTQANDRLHLDHARLDASLTTRTVAVGSPLFFTWTPQHRLAVFVGAPANTKSESVGWGSGRISVLDPEGRHAEIPLPGRPGNFCAPVAISDRVVYVAHDGAQVAIVASAPGEGTPWSLEPVDGLVALLPANDGRHILRGIAPDGDGTPYRSIARIDAITGVVDHIREAQALAFFPVGTEGGLLVARVNTARNLIEWDYHDPSGGIRTVGTCCPTRDFRFFLRFFEQFSQSHRIVDPVRRTVLLSGSPEDWNEASRKPQIFELNLDTGAVETIGLGFLGVYAPQTQGGAP